MIRTFLSVLLLNLGVICYGQQLNVVDSNNQKPIENVYIFDSQNSTLTNEHGFADLSKFINSDFIYLQHPSYQNLKISLQAIKDRSYIIKLKSSIFPIEEIVVSANKWEQNLTEVPLKVHRIDKKEILYSNSPTSAELLKSCNQVYIQKSQLGGGSPMIRGFAANRVLLVLDGVRLNNAIYRSGNLQNVISIDPNSLESAEIILGPGSTIYGSDAIGGVMDFHTITPLFSTSDKDNIRITYKNRYSSANGKLMNHASYNLGKKNLSLAGSFTYAHFGDQKMGSHGPKEYLRHFYAQRENGIDVRSENNNPRIQKESGYNQFNAVQKIRYLISHEFQLQYGFHYTTSSDIPRYDRLIQLKDDELKYAEWYYGPQKLQIHNLKIEAKRARVLYDSFKLNAAYQNYRESRHDRKFNSNTKRNRTEKLNIFSLNADAEKKLSSKSQLFYGLEFSHNRLNSDAFSLDNDSGETKEIASRYPDNSKLTSLAFYNNIKYKINSQWTLNSGIRYSQLKIDSKVDNTFYDFPFTNLDLSTGSLNGGIGVTFNSDSGWNLKWNGSTGFRAPNIDDIGKVFDSEPGKVVVPNKDLKPEYIYNFDFSFSKNFNQIFYLDFNSFYSYLDQAMVRSDYSFNGLNTINYDGTESTVQAIVNADYAKIYGANIQCILKFNQNISSTLNYSISKGKYKNGSPVRHVPPLFGSLKIDYQGKHYQSSIQLEINSKISYKNLAEVERNKAYLYALDENGNPYSPSWYTINWSNKYNISKTIHINFSIENILNKRYKNYSSGIANVGRNFVLGINFNL